MRHWWIGLVLLTLGCSSDDNAPNQECLGANCTDVGQVITPNDAGQDGLLSTEDCVTDGCSDGRLCNENTKKCVQCQFNEECGPNFVCNDFGGCECIGGFHECSGQCVSNTDIASCGTSCEPCPGPSNGNISCDGTACSFTCNDPLVPLDNQCVGCSTNTDCTGAVEPRCDSGTCVGCAEASDCTHIPGRATCDNGTCVECRSSADCGGNICDAGSCTTVAAKSVALCKECTTSEACIDGSVCMPLEFEGAPHGNYCLPIKSGEECPSPWGVEINRATVDGNTTTVCGLDEAEVTCEALLDYGSLCPSGRDSECGKMGLNDGKCEPVGFDFSLQCTYPCTSSSQCRLSDPEDLGCISGDYCGGP